MLVLVSDVYNRQPEIQTIDLSDDPALNIYRSRIGEILRSPLPLEEDSRNQLKPRRLVLSHKAKHRVGEFLQ